MTKHLLILATMAASVVVMPALAAGVTKTWVSSTTGNDAGTCQFTSPCKTFAYAITQTLAGGEIDVKDGGSYGPVTITQAVSIVNQGFLAAISVPSGATGVVVAAGSGDKVILQGLTIDGHGVGGDGVQYTSGASLIMDHCQVRNLIDTGINISNSAQSFYISDTDISNSAADGIYIHPIASVKGSLLRVGSYNNGNGVSAQQSTLVIINSIFSGNGTGLNTVSNGNILLGQSTIVANVSGIAIGQSSTVKSFGNNYLTANVSEVAGSLGSIAEQ